MYELCKITKDCYYVDSPTKVGIVKTGDNTVLLIDGGSDKDAAKKVLKVLDSQGWTAKKVLVTHSHADHIGGLSHIVEKTGAVAFAKGAECSFVEHTFLEPLYVWGGYPHKGIRNKIFWAQPTPVSDVSEIGLGDDYEIIDLYGHSTEQVGIITPDKTAYIGDAVSSETTLEKYGVTFLFDVKGFIDTLEKLKSVEANIFVPSHCEPTDDILPLVEKNLKKTYEVCDIVVDICSTPSDFDTILKNVFDRYSRALNENQYSIIGSSIRSYLSYLRDERRIEPIIQNNFMLWKRI